MKCYCHTCRPIDATDPGSVYMRLCLECGNKRCPKATDHNNECSGSNDAGQVGSIYGGRSREKTEVAVNTMASDGIQRKNLP